MRVAIVSECFLPVVNGVTNSVLRVCEHLRAGGHDVLVVAPGAGEEHCDVAGFAASYGLGLTARAAWRWTCRLHSMADRTLAPSSWATGALRSRGVPRVHQWARGVDTRRFTPSRRSTAWRRELAPNGERLVGYVGRLAPEKQVERLGVLAGLPGTRLVVVGDGPSAPTLREMLPNAAFLGHRGGDELADLYASLDVFVHPGQAETFCQAVQEALASGVPVVAPDAGGPRDLVLPERTGHLVAPRPDGGEPGDPETDAADAELRAAVAGLGADPPRRNAFGAAARQSVLRRTWTAVGDELVAHYTQVVGAAAPRAAA